MRRSLLLLPTFLIFYGASLIAAPFVPPDSLRADLNFNPDWKFIRQDVPDAQNPKFDDSKWATVSTPHTFNDIDSFRVIISHGSGDTGEYQGIAWYRKHFKLPRDYADRKIFIEFEGMRQAGKIYLNGKQVGLYENGITAYGIDLTPFLNFGDTENLIAVKVDNRTSYKEEATGTTFEWNVRDFNPIYGGINRHVWLHVMGKFYQTLPLYYGLETSGTYIYGQNYDIPNHTCDVTIESQVANATGDRGTASISAVVVDDAGNIRATLAGDESDMVDGEKDILRATGHMENARFWSPEEPYLYDVYVMLTVEKKIIDVQKIRTGFRKVEFKGGAGTGGVYINDKFTYLKGYSQRSSDEWAGLGQAYPDWMHDYTIQLMRQSNANYVRWMHVTPQLVDVNACDRFGIVEVSPAGDKEREVTGRQWDQRAEVMRDSTIYLRNHPSILFWEVGNTIVTPQQMVQMVDIRKQWDPNGGRVTGTRDSDNVEANTALTPVSEYYGVMMAQSPQTDALKSPTDIFRGYSAQRRDRAPLVEAEDIRDEGARRFWDDFSPPHFGFKPGPDDIYHWNSETFALQAATRYWDYWSNRISNTDPAHSKWSGYASIYFSDSNADGRQNSSEVCRVSGKVDAVRLPKEVYYTQQVMQSEVPAIHILGHWTYPENTAKTVCVISNCQSVELFLNGKSLGVNSKPQEGYVFAFPEILIKHAAGNRVLGIADSLPTHDAMASDSTLIKFEPGTLKAVGMNDGKPVCEYSLESTGAPASIKLTPITGPRGLEADGWDIVLVDVEVVDAQGRRCPTDEARVDFAMKGPGIWRGGYNSGIVGSTNNTYLLTEDGINRVSIRSTFEPGTITLTATRDGLTPATITIDSHPVKITDGIEVAMPPRLAAPASVLTE